MSRKLLIKLETDSNRYPPIVLEIAIPDDLARIIEDTPITSTTITVTNSMFITKSAQIAELKSGEINRFHIG